MKLAVISDIHANLHALEAVLDDLDQADPDLLVCLGDLVGYGAHPNEVVSLIRDRRIPTVMGNYKTLFVNTGSVGKPKGSDMRAVYAIVEIGRRPRVEFRRVAYDVAAAARAVRDSGLPPHFADLLESGGVAHAPLPEGATL